MLILVSSIITVCLVGIWWILPILASLGRYKVASIALWIGALSVFLMEPWKETIGFDGMFAAIIAMFITIPLYAIGIFAWIVGVLVRKAKHSETVRPQVNGSKPKWRIYFWVYLIIAALMLFGNLGASIVRDISSIPTLFGFVILFGYSYERITLNRKIAKTIFWVILVLEIIKFCTTIVMLCSFFTEHYTSLAIASTLGSLLYIIIMIPYFYGIYHYSKHEEQ